MNIKLSWNVIMLATCSVAVVSCSSSGSSSGDGSFTSVSNLVRDGKTENKIGGKGLSASADGDATISDKASTVTAYAKIDDEALTSVKLISGDTTREWNSSNASDGPDLDGGSGKFMTAQHKSVDMRLAVANPDELGFEYQTFGAWYDELPAPGALGGFSVGRSITSSEYADYAKSSTPDATFSGKAVGYVVDGSSVKAATSDASLAVKFSSNEANFSTSNTVDEDSTALSDYNMKTVGKLSVSSGSFSGKVETSHASGKLTGNVAGGFYGSKAKEAGGSFALNDGAASGKVYSGGFGVKR